MTASFNEIEQSAIDKSLTDFRASEKYSRLVAKPTYAFREFVLDGDFTRSVTGDAMFRLDQILHSKLFAARGRNPRSIEVNGLNFSDIKFYEHQSTGYHVLSSVLRDHRGDPICRFAWSTRIKDQDQTAVTIMTVATPSGPAGEFSLLLKSDLLRTHCDKEPGGVGMVSFNSFARFVDIMDYLRDPLADQLGEAKSGLMGLGKEHYQDGLELDGYLPGRLMRYAHDQIIRSGASQAHVRAARNLVKIASRLDKRGVHWGNAFILYGSRNRPIYSTLVKSPDRMAILTYDAGLDAQRRASMIWAERDAGTKSVKTFITGIKDGDDIKETVKAFMEGSPVRSITSTCLLSDPDNSLTMTRRFVESGAFEGATYCTEVALQDFVKATPKRPRFEISSNFSGFAQMMGVEDWENNLAPTP